MPTRLTKPPATSPSAGAMGGVYAYESAIDWLSLDPHSKYRGLDGLKRMWREFSDDFNKDGKVGLGAIDAGPNGRLTVDYVPATPRIQVRADSIITTTSVPAPGGCLEFRHAAPRE